MERIKSYSKLVFGSLSSKDPQITTPHQLVKIQEPLLSEEKITSRTIERIMPQMQEGVREIKNALLNGEYTALIGDDTSGRIPTLILRSVISQIYTAYGRRSLPAFFIQGDYDPLTNSQDSRLSNYISSLCENEDDQRALIVTEHIESGSHIRNIGKPIHNNGVPYDVFTIGRDGSINKYRKSGTILEDENIFPTTHASLGCPSIHGRNELSGYKKGENGEVVFTGIPRTQFVDARRDIQIAAAQLIKRNFV